jgi:hypothetical protein
MICRWVEKFGLMSIMIFSPYPCGIDPDRLFPLLSFREQKGRLFPLPHVRDTFTEQTGFHWYLLSGRDHPIIPVFVRAPGSGDPWLPTMMKRLSWKRTGIHGNSSMRRGDRRFWKGMANLPEINEEGIPQECMDLTILWNSGPMGALRSPGFLPPGKTFPEGAKAGDSWKVPAGDFSHEGFPG